MSSEQPRRLAQASPAWAWAAYEPGPGNPWDLGQVAHLHRRAGLGASWEQLQQDLARQPAEVVARLIAGDEHAAEFENQMAVAAAPLLGSDDIDGLAAWWLYAMQSTGHPLQERMTLYWHGHFATSQAKVNSPRLMYRQHQKIRAHALGQFGALLSEMSRDPAMLIWLDAATNKKSHPNENFAREVMELFSLGLGNYTEQDIQEAARAFTGWELRQDRFFFNPYQHDRGAKTVLGATGAWNGDDVLRILLEQNAAAEYLVRRMFRYFISEVETPSSELIAPLAVELRQRSYDLSWLLGAMLGSNLFFSPLARRQKIKGPVELAIGLIRGLEGTTNAYQLAKDLGSLGQALFEPPTVKGWDGGREWITSATMLGRMQLVWALVNGSHGEYGNKIDLAALLQRQGVTGVNAAVDRLALLLLGELPTPEIKIKLLAAAQRSAQSSAQGDTTNLGYARVVQAIAALPQFQLA